MTINYNPNELFDCYKNYIKNADCSTRRTYTLAELAVNSVIEQLAASTSLSAEELVNHTFKATIASTEKDVYEHIYNLVLDEGLFDSSWLCTHEPFVSLLKSWGVEDIPAAIEDAFGPVCHIPVHMCEAYLKDLHKNYL